MSAPRPRHGPGCGHAGRGATLTTLPPAETTATAVGQRAVADLQRLLHDLGAGPELLRGVCLRADLGGREYVYVPSLPVGIVEYLARLLPPGAAS